MVCARPLSEPKGLDPMASDRDVDPRDQTIVDEFCHLLEKSKQLFNGLRELPQHGHKEWKSYFGRTFDVYTKLWKFQQQHRQKLDEIYGLKRWQIGEVASKIGQLYHRYYLRTSDLYYLNESFAFFSAIRTRDYYSKASKEDKPDLMVKKLRYYARYILDFAKQVDEYTTIYDSDDQLGWDIVVQEIRDFIDGDTICDIINEDLTHAVISNRLNAFNCSQVPKFTSSYLRLSEVIIVGNCYDQFHFSELSLDMYRMLQTMERDPKPIGNNRTIKPHDAIGNGALGGYSTDNWELNNPHKYLLYKPTFSQFNSCMAAAFKDLHPTGILFLYISSDGFRIPSTHCGDDSHKNPTHIGGYDLGGVVTNNRHEQEFAYKPKKIDHKEPHCIHPGDIVLYTRKPVFLIVDSDNSSAFRHLPNLFGQPFVSLLSPETVPEKFEHQRYKGSLFTLFLHQPVLAFCYLCNQTQISVKLWDRAQTLLESFFKECYTVLTRSRSLDFSYQQFFADDFLRTLILRYCFCSVVLQLHRSFNGSSFYPSCSPVLPSSELMECRVLHRIVLELATLIDCRSMFAVADDYSKE